MKTLLVEDELSSQLFLEEQISLYGHEVTLCADAETALEAYQQSFYPLIVSDLGLPGMDGLEFCRQIRSLPQGDRSMILVITARDTPEDLQAVLNAGADDYLTKPVSAELLNVRLVIVTRQLENLTQRKQAEDALRESEELHRLTLTSISDAVFITDETGRFTFICPNVHVIFGYSFEEVRTMGNIEKLLGTRLFDPNELATAEEIPNIEREIIDKHGTHHMVLVNVKQVSIRGGTVLYSCRDITERKQAEEELRQYRRAAIKERYKFGDIVGKSLAMQEVYELMLQASASDTNVLIYGESGTGKELVAWTIHYMSARKEKAFVPVNCGAIPEGLFESELFGHRKGAFTGAQKDKPGFFDAAEEGTLFLDEVGELKPSMQVKLLRAVAGDGYAPIGDHRIRKPDLRIIAATNQNLTEHIKQGKMREDFFYRIHVIAITLPPLRERREDIPLLIDYFLEQSNKGKKRPELPGKVLEAMYTYDWPGNVRELQNVLQRYLTTKRLDFIGARQIEPFQIGDVSGAEFDYESLELQEALEEFEKRLIAKKLYQHNWQRSHTAKTLGITTRTLHRKMTRYQLKESYREPFSEQ